MADDGHARAPSAQPCRLFQLLQELQDMIFSLAYPPMPRGSQLIFKRDWDEDQERRRRTDRTNFVAVPFPDPKVCSFLVSKAWFEITIKTYIEGQFWRGSSYLVLYDDVGIFHTYVRHLRVTNITGTIVNKLSQCPNLRILELQLDYDCFGVDGDKFVWEDEYTPTDFEAVARMWRVTDLRGLSELRIEAGYYSYANSEFKRMMWKTNVARFEEYVRPIVCQPKGPVVQQSKEEERLRSKPRNKFEQNSSTNREIVKLRSDPNPPAQHRRGRFHWLGLGRQKSRSERKAKDGLLGSQPQVKVKPHNAALRDADIPDSARELVKLLKRRGPEVMAWIKAKKATTAEL